MDEWRGQIAEWVEGDWARICQSQLEKQRYHVEQVRECCDSVWGGECLSLVSGAGTAVSVARRCCACYSRP